MKSIRPILILCFCAFVLYERLASHSPTVSSPAFAPASSSSSSFAHSDTSATDASSVPAKALRVLQIVRATGDAPDGYVGGRVFQNREGRLPSDGDYREFDVDPHTGGRNAERIIVEWNTKRAWYTSDHYQTFIPMP